MQRHLPNLLSALRLLVAPVATILMDHVTLALAVFAILSLAAYSRLFLSALSSGRRIA